MLLWLRHFWFEFRCRRFVKAHFEKAAIEQWDIIEGNWQWRVSEQVRFLAALKEGKFASKGQQSRA